jgi:hypothetical protein
VKRFCKKKIAILLCFSLLILLPVMALATICVAAEIEQRMYLSKTVPILREISSLDDKKLSTLEHTDSWGFTTEFTTTKLKDGWVIILQRVYIADEDPTYLREYFRHRIIIYKDSAGRIYIKAQGMLPPGDVNNKGEDDYEPTEDITVLDFFNREKKSLSSDPGWVFWVEEKGNASADAR